MGGLLGAVGQAGLITGFGINDHLILASFLP